MELRPGVPLPPLQLRPVKNAFEGLDPTPPPAPENVVLSARNHLNSLRGGARVSPQHHRYVLILNLQTDGTVCADSARVRLKRGEALLIFPFQVHFYSDLAETDLRWLFLTFECQDGRWLAPLRNQPVQLDTDDRRLLEWLLEDWQLSRAGIGWATGCLLRRLLRKNSARKTPKRTPPRPERLFERINRAVYRDPGKLWTIDRLAREVAISPSHLRERFRRETGISLGNYLLQLRMNRASAMLATSSRTITEIADACGYESLFSFSRAFRRHAKRSPSDYRKNFR